MWPLGDSKPPRPFQFWSTYLTSQTIGRLKGCHWEGRKDLGLPMLINVDALKAKSLPKIFKNLSDKDREAIRAALHR